MEKLIITAALTGAEVTREHRLDGQLRRMEHHSRAPASERLHR
ncbi:MAG: hypothetical protein R6U08_01895 [Bacillota bacterium]